MCKCTVGAPRDVSALDAPADGDTPPTACVPEGQLPSRRAHPSPPAGNHKTFARMQDFRVSLTACSSCSTWLGMVHVRSQRCSAVMPSSMDNRAARARESHQRPHVHRVQAPPLGRAQGRAVSLCRRDVVVRGLVRRTRRALRQGNVQCTHAHIHILEHACCQFGWAVRRLMSAYDDKAGTAASCTQLQLCSCGV